MRRDDFSPLLMATLAKRVNFRSSNSQWDRPTSGPFTEPNKTASIGVGEHSTAASPGGPRFTASSLVSAATNVLAASRSPTGSLRHNPHNSPSASSGSRPSSRPSGRSPVTGHPAPSSYPASSTSPPRSANTRYPHSPIATNSMPIHSVPASPYRSYSSRTIPFAHPDTSSPASRPPDCKCRRMHRKRRYPASSDCSSRHGPARHTHSSSPSRCWPSNKAAPLRKRSRHTCK